MGITMQSSVLFVKAAGERLTRTPEPGRLLAPAAPARTAAAASDDGPVQTLCAEAAIAGMRDGAYDEVLDPLLSARSPRVRAVGVTALRRAGRHDEAAVFLADRSGVVGACARYVLRQGGIDPLPLYRSMCTDPAARPAALAGLGECGTRKDAPALWSLVTHPAAAVRVHAVTGLRALDAVRHERLRPLLGDPSPAVVRAVTQALLPDADRIPHE
ncbi:HEAT repeat domain-containing protein [Streptomyces sp. NBC_00316]|uniref:HEAT repeat domain-containing protein n=1 Tax=Streptomyces sp. NBC_00316 TaxID=2975710 RepID=UPI002E27C9F9|nr:HEAT repeat domain-containing protein [Streptomyces sp. NBC_00316]